MWFVIGPLRGRFSWATPVHSRSRNVAPVDSRPQRVVMTRTLALRAQSKLESVVGFFCYPAKSNEFARSR